MTCPRNELDLNSFDQDELASSTGKLVTDGGEDLPDHEDIRTEFGEEYVEHHPDGFVSGEPDPEPTVDHEGYTGGYYRDSHLQPGYGGDPEPPWGYEDGSARPRGPPCRDCGEIMMADSFRWAPDTGQTVDSAICEDCGLGWGPFTGWVDLDGSSSSTRSDADEC